MQPPAPSLTLDPHPLPGVTAPASLDFIAFEAAKSRVWIPEGTTGSVYVYDIAAKTFATVSGFKVVEREAHGKTRKMGPSAVTIGDGFAFIGDRGTGEVCPVDTATLKTSPCVKLAAPTDAVSYVASTKEIWATTPDNQSLVVIDASKPAKLRVKATVKVPGSPEGYAVDNGGGHFFTNLEDKDETLVIDVKTRKVVSTWSPKCGAEGPRGIVFDDAHKVLFVACTDHVQGLDPANGALLGKIDTGAGLDNLELASGRLYAAAGKAAKLTIATVGEKGQLAVVVAGDTSASARNTVVDGAGTAYLADAAAARLLVANVTSEHK